MTYSKYWLIESEQGLDGIEFEEAKSYQDALSLAKTEIYNIYEIYPVTRKELYLSGVDIY